MERIERDVRDAAENAAERGSDKIKEFGSKVKDGAERLGDKAQEAGRRVSSPFDDSALADARKALEDGKDRLTEMAEDLYGDVVSALKKNPGQSLAAVLMLGIGVGALLFRKRE